jgi:prepilin-type N-terminal cleavage/methylation domain-containing protein
MITIRYAERGLESTIMMSTEMKQNDHGFTLVEIVVVLVLITIIAAASLTRSITTDQINFVGQADKIIAHLHYARSMAMKRNEIWGIFYNKSQNQYWLFQWTTTQDEVNNKKILPGCETEIISLTELNLTMNPPFVLYFDGTGKPYEMTPSNPIDTDLEITIENSDKSQSKTFTVTPETGLIRLQ